MISALSVILSRPKTVLAMMLVMIAAGVASYIAVPKEAQPDIDVPVYFVSVNQQGIAPQDAERLLIRPMEAKLRGLDGLKELTAVASQSNALVVLEFIIDTDKDKVLADIRDKVDQAKSEFPDDADEPVIAETNFALQPTIIVTLSGQVPERTLFQYSRRLKDEIEAISSVREANLSGNREEMLEVVLDLDRLESYNISQNELLNALNQNNQLIAAGFIDNGKGRFNLKVPGLVEDARDVYSIPIKQNGEAIVTLGDVSEIRRTFKDASTFTRVNGEPAIALEVVKRIGTNIIENNKAVRETVAKFSKDWPATIKINYLLDQSSFIGEVQSSLQASIMTAIALVMVVVVFSLGLRSGLLVGLSVPVSFAVGFMIVGLAGMTVNMMVLFGMVLTVGMLVDGAIVVTEYADRKLAEGMAPSEAYTRAAQLMFWPVVSSTATTLAAFLPLLLWPGVPGEFMSYLPIMVIIVLSASLITAMIFLPTAGAITGRIAQWAGRHAAWFMSALIAALFVGFAAFSLTQAVIADLLGFGLSTVLATTGEIAGTPQGGQILASSAAAIVGLLIAVALFPILRRYIAWRSGKQKTEDNTTLMFTSQRKLEIDKVSGLMGTYLRFLRFVSGNIIGNALVIATVVGVAFIVFGAFGKNSKGVEFFVNEEPDAAIVLVSARGNLSALQIRDIVGDVEQRILRVSGIDNVVSTATAPGGRSGAAGGAPPAVQDKPADAVGQLQIELSDFCCRRLAEEIFKDIRETTATMPGVRVEVRKIEGGPPTGKDLRLQVRSTDYGDMVAAVARSREFFDSLSGIQDHEDGRPLPGIELQLTVDREQAGRYNAGIVAIGSMVQMVTNGVQIGRYRPSDAEDEVEIRVRLPEEQRSLATLDRLKLRTPNGQVPLANFITRAPLAKVGSITRKDGLYSMEVKANLIPGFEENGKAVTPDDKVKQVQAWLDSQTWPETIQFKFKGSDEEQKESGEFLAKAAAIALFLMFIILVTQFNSFYQTVLTLSTVVLAILGVLIGLMVTGQKFSIIMTGTGVVALAGIVVNNAIVLIDTYNRLREEGVGTREAVLKTSAQRIRPIMLTTTTTILGLVPMALQINMNFFSQTIAYGGITSVWWVQLSTAIISGLAFSTLLTLIVIPSMLAMPANMVAPFNWIATRFFGRSTDALPAQSAAATAAVGDLNAMMVSAMNAGNSAAVEANPRHPEDSSIIPMPAKLKEKPGRESYPQAAE